MAFIWLGYGCTKYWITHGGVSLDISVVVPVYNEQENISKLHKFLIQTLISIKKDFEIIFVDDGSADDSWSIMREIKIESKNI